MNEREQNLLIAANEVVGDFNSYGAVLQQSRKEDYGPESSIGQLIESLQKYDTEDFTCETTEKTHQEIVDKQLIDLVGPADYPDFMDWLESKWMDVFAHMDTSDAILKLGYDNIEACVGIFKKRVT